MRQVNLDWATGANVKSFFNNLASADKPNYTIVASLVRTYNAYYYGGAFLKYDGTTISLLFYGAYNNASGGGTNVNDTDVLKGQVTWFVD